MTGRPGGIDEKRRPALAQFGGRLCESLKDRPENLLQERRGCFPESNEEECA